MTVGWRGQLQALAKWMRADDDDSWVQARGAALGGSLLLALLLALQGVASASGEPAETPAAETQASAPPAAPSPTPREYPNPILPGSHPDPSIVRVGEDYYLVTSSFEYFPGIPIFHSRDLVHWRPIGHVLTRRSQLPLGRARSSGGAFAATIRHHDGTFYVITTNVGPGTNFFVTATDPAGPWSEPIVVNKQGMDPSLLFVGGSAEPGGAPARVFYTSQFGFGQSSHVVQAEIDLATGELKGELLPIWRGSGGPWTEGPHLYATDGRYYLLAAEGGTHAKHSSVVARAKKAEGPFHAFAGNPIATHRGQPGSIQNVGHADLVQTPEGHWFAVLHGIRVRGKPLIHVLGRETFLAPVQWIDGWPSIGRKGRIAKVMSAILPPPHPWPEPELRDEFDSDALGFEWNFLRNPTSGSWTLDARPGWLRLRGNAASLDGVGAPSFVGRRQEHVKFRAATRLTFEPHRRGDEAGLALRLSEEHHCEIALSSGKGGRRVRLILRNGATRRTLSEHKIASRGPVTLQVTSNGRRYAFSYRVGEAAQQSLGDIKTALLSNEVGGSMTGVYIALYASGNGAASAAPADFDWFEYAPR